MSTTVAKATGALRLMLFIGSTRPNRIGARVSKFAERTLTERGHKVQIVDPLELQFPILHQPHFVYPAGKAPAKLEELAHQIRLAEGYVVVSPEYNHTISPAITNTFAHFGNSLFAYKPSAIVTYSIGQWGGMRAAMALRPFLSEIGCLPVSSILAIPKAQEVFAPDGSFVDPSQQTQWDGYAAKTWAQLEWVGNAFKEYKERVDPWEHMAPNEKMSDRFTPSK